MIPFDSSDPYPFSPGIPYRSAQEHASQVDAWLGLRIAEVEQKIASEKFQWRDHQAWVGLPFQTLLTPYTEIREMLERLSPEPGWTLLDLGAGYGRMGFVLGRHFPEASFLGYELVSDRVNEGNRCLGLLKCANARLETRDLSSEDFALPSADVYFIYDYGTRAAIERTLQQLREKARARSVRVIGRGRATRDAIERVHPWLSQVVPPEHHGNWSFYRSAL